MNRCISSSRRITAAFFAITVFAISGSVFAQTVDQVLQADQRRLNLAQQSQERINKIVEGTRSLRTSTGQSTRKSTDSRFTTV